jgi:high-affinity Fe2+/Pb2+ permease
LLKTLFGYNGNPSLTEMIGYFVYIVVVAVLFNYSTIKRDTKAPQPQA